MDILCLLMNYFNYINFTITNQASKLEKNPSRYPDIAIQQYVYTP